MLPINPQMKQSRPLKPDVEIPSTPMQEQHSLKYITENFDVGPRSVDSYVDPEWS